MNSPEEDTVKARTQGATRRVNLDTLKSRKLPQQAILPNRQSVNLAIREETSNVSEAPKLASPTVDYNSSSSAAAADIGI